MEKYLKIQLNRRSMRKENIVKQLTDEEAASAAWRATAERAIRPQDPGSHFRSILAKIDQGLPLTFDECMYLVELREAGTELDGIDV